MDAIRHCQSVHGVTFDHKVIQRNLASYCAGNGLTHSGPKNLFEPADVREVHEIQKQRALHVYPYSKQSNKIKRHDFLSNTNVDLQY